MFHFVPGVPRKNGTLCRRESTNLRFASSKATTVRGCPKDFFEGEGFGLR